MTAFTLAERFIGVKEIAGAASNPLVLAMLRLDDAWPEGDEVPWCSAFVNFITWMLRLPRSKSLAARSWLAVGRVITFDEAQPSNDIVILERGTGAGHVGFFAGRDDAHHVVHILGGNQQDGVNVSVFPVERMIGLRRLKG
jgi:uncharacterized protein (TIGR02594 family)